MSAPENQASSVEGFLNTLGINANILPTAPATIISQLQYLGIDQVRAQAPTSAAAAAAFSAIGSTGVKFDLITTYWELPITSMLLSTMFSYIDMMAADVQSVEGPNEVQNDPDSYEGLTGQAEWTALQNTLYQMVRDDPNLTNAQQTTAVLSFSNVPGGNYTSPLASTDFASVHAYGQPGILPYNVVNPTIGVTTIAPGKPIIVSESGQTTVPTSQGVSGQEQALYDTDLFIDDYAAGVSKTYLFNLQDFNSGPNDLNFPGWYGLYNSDGTIKPAGLAIHNLTTILADPTANETQVAGSLAYTLVGLPDNGHHILLEKSDGAFDLVVWIENDGQYNTAAETLNFAPTTSLTLSFGGNLQVVSVYDPITGSSAVQNLGAVASVALSLGSDPLIVQIAPDTLATTSASSSGTASTPAAVSLPTLTVGSGPDSVVLQVSEDASVGDAQFTVSIDGTEVGGILTVAAIHSAGQDQAVDILNDLTPGQHVVSVDFLNDNGPRNLYVDSTAVGGTSVSGGTHALYWDGSVATAFVQPDAPSPPVSPPVQTVGSGVDLLALGMSENAYLGNAQFTIRVDGTQVGGTLTATALHDVGQSQTVDVLGDFAAGANTVAVDFLNDLWQPGVGDRNLFVTSATINGTAVANGTLSLYSGGSKSLSFIQAPAATPTLSVGSGVLALQLGVSEDAYEGDAQFSISVDGKQIGGTLTATAIHAAGQSQVVDVLGALTPGEHTLTLDFLNDAYSGVVGGGDRNLYLDSATGVGTSFTSSSLSLFSGGPRTTQFIVASHSS